MTLKSCYYVANEKSRAIAIADVSPYYGIGYIITRVHVLVPERKRGFGNLLMSQILEDADADAQKVRLYLEINPYGEMTYDQLEAWYFRLGFKKWMGIYRRLPV